MRILFLVSSMQGGGAERVAALLCNYWTSQGHNVVLMPTFSRRGECVYPLDDGVRLEYLADHVHTYRLSLWNRLARLKALRKVVREFSPHVVISFLTGVNIAAILATRGLGVPVIVSERVYPPAVPLGFFLEFLRRLTYSRADRVVAQTTEAGRWLSNHCPGTEVEIIANPVAWPLPVGTMNMEPDEWLPGDRHVVLSAGRMVPQKGFDLLISAFGLIAEEFPDWLLVIIGEGNERENLEALRSQLGLKERVLLPGHVNNLAEWYVRSDIFVMSSRFEGFPNVLLEAMAHGVASISFDCLTGPDDIIEHGKNGLLITSCENVNELSGEMRRLMSNPVLKNCLGKAAVKVREQYSVNRIGGQWDAMLQSVVQQKTQIDPKGNDS